MELKYELPTSGLFPWEITQNNDYIEKMLNNQFETKYNNLNNEKKVFIPKKEFKPLYNRMQNK